MSLTAPRLLQVQSAHRSQHLQSRCCVTKTWRWPVRSLHTQQCICSQARENGAAHGQYSGKAHAGFFIRTPATSPHKTATAPQTKGRGRAQPWERVLQQKLPPLIGRKQLHCPPTEEQKTLSAKSHGSDLLLVFSLPLLAPRGPRVTPLPSRGMVAHTRSDCWPAGMPRPPAGAPRRQRREFWRRRWERRAARRRISISCCARESAGREEEYEWDTARCWRSEAGRPQRLH